MADAPAETAVLSRSFDIPATGPFSGSSLGESLRNHIPEDATDASTPIMLTVQDILDVLAAGDVLVTQHIDDTLPPAPVVDPNNDGIHTTIDMIEEAGVVGRSYPREWWEAAITRLRDRLAA